LYLKFKIMGKLVFVWVGIFICLQKINAQTSQHIYDNSGRLIEISYPAQKQKILYTYDKDGNRISEVISAIVQDSLLVQPDTLHFANIGGSKTVTVRSNRSWIISSNQSWATVNKTSGNKNDSVVITANGNPTSAIRMAVITFTTGAVTQTVFVTQDSTSNTIDSLDLDKNLINVPYTGNTEIITVASNRSWTVQSNQSWATVFPSSGSGNGGFSVNTIFNSTGAVRNAWITVSAGTETETVHVLQSGQSSTGTSEANEKPSIAVFPNPANNVLYIVSESLLQGGFYTLVDINGRIILSGQLAENTQTHTVSLNVMNGIYTLVLEISNKVIREKIVVMR
jgi:YD repeat-containing protein